jgi:hypothetical protein
MQRMEPATDTFLGFDPGGKNGFGAAMLSGRNVATTTVGTVAEAGSWVIDEAGPTSR